MTETPDERRERIDDARRAQAELNRQIGQEFANLAIRPSAMQAWDEFQAAQKSAEREVPSGYAKCRDKQAQYQDYDPFHVPSPAKAKMMCATCRFSTLSGDGTCGRFAVAERPAHGVWDGIVYGRDQDDRDRRAILKEQKEEA